MKYPKKVFVQHELDGKEQYLTIADKPEDVLNDGEVAIYELKKLAQKKTKVVIEDK